MQPHADTHVFVYLVTRPSPMDFRLFLLRHVPLLRVLFRWTVRLLLPRKLVKARLAYLHAARERIRDTFTPFGSGDVWSGCSPNGSGSPNRVPRLLILATSTPPAPSARRGIEFSTNSGWTIPRNTLWMAGSPIVADAIERELGRVECVELSTTYCISPPWLTSPDINSRGRPGGRARKSRIIGRLASEQIPQASNDASDGRPASTADNRFSGRKFHRERATPTR